MVATNKLEIIVSLAESEQKIFQFLLRRLNLPKPLLHRWLRKGKIRCNGLKIKPFVRIIEGDIILVPNHIPSISNLQDAILSKQTKFKHEPDKNYLIPNSEHNIIHALPQQGLNRPLAKTLRIIYEDNELLVCNKPAGLPTHLGSGHKDSLISMVHRQYNGNTFKPTPVHRLDKDTSGLLLIALSYKTLRNLQEAFKNQEVTKEYLAWVEGKWPYDYGIQLQHKLEKKYSKAYEKVQEGTGKNSICLVYPLLKDAEKSLLQIRLITGRTHQIRAQLASQGFPLYGDMKYGSKKRLDLKLHAFRLIVPYFKHFELLPTWTKGFDIITIPKPLSIKDIN